MRYCMASGVDRMFWYTLSFTVPHRKKSSSDRSGERAGHCTWIVTSTVVVVCLHVKTANTTHDVYARRSSFVL
ncbi:hypothetical protein ANN_03775 [Periplaneta americana]|uniref:Secreted protein n=1 Tax=Periplaneta americana TaxID=6978 RepID=A0ABQ8U219_PERAM|nr:hypothetical protein ANN_03775 [Periplaneta americana]